MIKKRVIMHVQSRATARVLLTNTIDLENFTLSYHVFNGYFACFNISGGYTALKHAKKGFSVSLTI